MSRKIDDAFLYSILFTVIYYGWAVVFNLIFHPAKPMLKTTDVFEAFVGILAINIFFAFQRTGRLTLRLAAVILVGVPIAVYVVIVKFNFTNLIPSMVGGGEKEALGVVGIIGNWLYDLLLSKHVSTVKSVVTILSVFIETLQILLLEAFVLVCGHVFHVLPITTSSEEEIIRFKLDNLFWRY